MLWSFKEKKNSCTTIKDQFENLYAPDALEKMDMDMDTYIYLVAVFLTANLKDITHTIKIPENLFLLTVSVHNHLLVKQQEINDERGL